MATAEYRHTPDAPKPITKVLFGGHSMAGFKITSGVAQGRGYHMLRFGRVTIPRDLLAISLVLIAAFGSACGVAGPSACTVIGCTGLVVEVTGAPGSTPVTVVVTAPDGSTRSTTCTSASGACPVSFPDFTPATVTIRVSTGNQTTEVTKQPTYEVTRPNGPACPPECRNARVTVVL